MRVLVTGGRKFSPDVACTGIVGYLRAYPLPAGERITIIHGACLCDRMGGLAYAIDADPDSLRVETDVRSFNEMVRATTKGADLGAEWAAAILGANRWAFPAEWEYHGRAGGTLRNQEMLDDARPDLALAFPSPDSRGTLDMIRRVAKAGIPIEVWEP